MTIDGDGRRHQFGGDWTDKKLDILKRYLSFYTTALAKQPFRLGYIDAFAGTGYRDPNRLRALEPDNPALPNLLDQEEPQSLLDGSVRIALRTEPRFDGYVFIEKDAERCEQLERLRDEFPDRADSISVIRGDANSEIQRLCHPRMNWQDRRAVLFLDPYGMQVEWETIVAIARTRAIDLWLLFPLGIGVNRLLTRTGEIPEGWRRRLTLLLGTDEWFDAFYQRETTVNLFGEPSEQVLKASLKTIGEYFNNRLATVFAGVAGKPAILRNSSNNPLYLLCFAVGNPSPTARRLALKGANHILRKV